MPGFFFKRLELDQLGKSRAFYKKTLLFPENARLFRLKLRTRRVGGWDFCVEFTRSIEAVALSAAKGGGGNKLRLLPRNMSVYLITDDLNSCLLRSGGVFTLL